MQFKLKFDPKEIQPLAARRKNSPKYSEAMEAGSRIQQGQCTRENLEKIFRWKTRGRGGGRLIKNEDAEIADALKLATMAKTDRAALAVLVGLNGVRVPVASAILAAIDPEKFTVIDVRALEALNVTNPRITINLYLDYLNECRRLACENSVKLRTLDEALWQWSKERSSGKRHFCHAHTCALVCAVS